MSALEAFERCIRVGGVAVFPSDTVYGLACDVSDRVAVERLYALKHRTPEKSAAVMFFEVERALAAVPELGRQTVAALRRLLPGAVTVLVPNPGGRYPLACGGDGATLGLRVPRGGALDGATVAVLQSSANFAGGAEARVLSDVPAAIRSAADLVIDGGELPGTSSTVVDLREYERDGSWSVVRVGAVGVSELELALADR